MSFVVGAWVWVYLVSSQPLWCQTWTRSHLAPPSWFVQLQPWGCWLLQHQGLLDMFHVPVPVVEPWAVGWLTRPAAPYEMLRAGAGLVGEWAPLTREEHMTSLSPPEKPWGRGPGITRHACLAGWENCFPQKGEKGAFPSPFLDSLSFGCFAQEDSAGHAEEMPYRIGSGSLAASQTAVTGLACQGQALRSDLETTTSGETIWMLNVRGTAHLSSGFHHFCRNWGFLVWWTWYFTFSPFLGIWGRMKHCPHFQRIQHFLQKMVEKT